MTDKIHVYEAIAAIIDEMSKEGITKDHKNQQQGYSFRGIDDVFNALSPMLAKHKLCILPRVIERDCVERQTSQNKPIFYTTVKAEFDFVSAMDGSKRTVSTFGEAMDSADKSTNKAMSAAYKYAAFQAFCIPTEGDNDADAHTHEVAPKQTPQPVAAPKSEPIVQARKEFIIKTIMDAKNEPIATNLKDAAKQECIDAGDNAAWNEIFAQYKIKLKQLKGE